MAERELPRALAGHLDADVARLVGDVRDDAVRRVRAALVDSYVTALRERLRGERPGGHESRSRGCYLYAVVPGDGAGVGVGLPGVQPRHAIRLHSAGDLSAVVSDVDLDELSELGAADNADEDSALAAAVRAHDTVVDTAFRAGPVVPLRFGTVLPDEASVDRLLSTHAEELRAELARLAAGKEWGVKLYAPQQEPSAVATTPAIGGRDYLATQSRQRANQREAAESSRRVAERVLQELRPLVDDAVGGATRHTSEAQMLVNQSFFVADTQESAFLSALDRLAEVVAADGMWLERTGPWPPYHFVRLDLTVDES